MTKNNSEILNITVNVEHYKNWGIIEAIREIIQNTLDTIPTFKANINIEQKEIHTVFENDKGVLSPKSWVIGGTTKRDDKKTMGTFGEGLKAGLLILISNGYKCLIKSGKYTYEPFIEYEKSFEMEILKVRKFLSPLPINGTKVFVYGLEKLYLDNGKKYFLYFQDYTVLHKDKKLGHEIIFMNDHSRNRIYLNGQAVNSQKDKIFSYNIITDNTNRDRDIFDKDIVHDNIMELIVNSRNFDIIKKFIQCTIHDTERNYLESTIYTFPSHKSLATFKNVIKSIYGSRVAIFTNDIMKSEVELRGYTVIQPEYNLEQILKRFLKKDYDILIKSGKEYHYFKGKLPLEYRRNYKNAKTLISQYFPQYNVNDFKYKIFTHTIAEQLNPDEKIQDIKISKTLGYAQYLKKEIGIRLSVLSDFSETLHVLYHELTHHYKHSSDNSRAFETDLIEPFIQLIQSLNVKNKNSCNNVKKINKLQETIKSLKSEIRKSNNKPIKEIPTLPPIEKPIEQKLISIRLNNMDKIRIHNGKILLPYKVCKKLNIKPNYTGKGYINIGIID